MNARIRHRAVDLLDDAGRAVQQHWSRELGWLWLCELPLSACLLTISSHILAAGSRGLDAVHHDADLLLIALAGLLLAIYGQARFAQAVAGDRGRRPATTLHLGWQRYLLQLALQGLIYLAGSIAAFTLLPAVLLPWLAPLGIACGTLSPTPSLRKRRWAAWRRNKIH
jgi:uncharacterized membrane-anchored protein